MIRASDVGPIERGAALRRVALVVLVLFVAFLVLGWMHAAGVIGHDHAHHAGHDAGDRTHDAGCAVCDALILNVGAALFVAWIAVLAGSADLPARLRPPAPLLAFEPQRIAAPRGPPLA